MYTVFRFKVSGSRDPALLKSTEKLCTPGQPLFAILDTFWPLSRARKAISGSARGSKMGPKKGHFRSILALF